MIWVLVAAFGGLSFLASRRSDKYGEMSFIYALLAVVFAIIGLIKLVQP